MAVKVFVCLMILGYVVAMPEQTMSTHDSLDANDEDSEEWESVGELIYDYNVTSADDGEELLQDANDPMVLSDDLCHSLLGIYADMPEQFSSVLSEMRLDQSVRGFARCLRTRRGNNFLCRGRRFVNFRSFRYCCRNPVIRPLLTRNRNFVRCRC